MFPERACRHCRRGGGEPARTSIRISMLVCAPESEVPNRPIAARVRASTRPRPSSLITVILAVLHAFQRPALQILLARGMGSAHCRQVVGSRFARRGASGSLTGSVVTWQPLVIDLSVTCHPLANLVFARKTPHKPCSYKTLHRHFRTSNPKVGGSGPAAPTLPGLGLQPPAARRTFD